MQQQNLRIDETVASGYAVPVEVDLGRPQANAVREATLLAPRNPQARVLRLELGPMATGRVATRIRLARSQTVQLVARRDGGLVIADEAPVDVLVGGCGFDIETPG